MKEALYHFCQDVGQLGNLSGLSIAKPRDVSAILGKPVYFNEIQGHKLGIYGEVKRGNIFFITDNQALIIKLRSTLNEAPLHRAVVLLRSI